MTNGAPATLLESSFSWAGTLADPVAIRCLALMLFCLTGIMLCTGVLNRRRPRSRRGDDGNATLEFALVVPVLLALTLVLIQTTLVMSNIPYVHYAAFAATRSAVVQIPVDDGNDESANRIRPSRDSRKYAAIRRAAVFAVVPISGQLDTAGTTAARFATALGNLYAAYDRPNPNWVDRLAADRLAYADANTDVLMVQTTVDEDGTVRFVDMEEHLVYMYGMKDPVTVRVEHRLNLAIPYARAIFADARAETGRGRRGSTMIRAQYTLTNEGISDQLPVRPALPRVP